MTAHTSQTSHYGTRRTLAAQSTPIAIAPSSSAGSTLTGGSPLSSSLGKLKTRRPSTTALNRRRLSSSSVAQRPGASSLPNGGRGGALGLVGMDDADDGEVKGTVGKREKGQLFECEKCKKIYRHSTCLVKHRWEHTAHWKEASKLLLSKHQQVQLLEAAAILKAASSGSSLPDEKSYWPAAVSPPSSGLLGSHALNIHTLSPSSLPLQLPSPSSSPYPSFNKQSLSLSSRSPYQTYSPTLSSSLSTPYLDDEPEEGSDDEDEESAESVSTGDDMLAEGMFDMEIDEVVGAGGAVASFSSRQLGADSGFGSKQEDRMDGPVLGFFQGRV